jgi:hypothetical protein
VTFVLEDTSASRIDILGRGQCGRSSNDHGRASLLSSGACGTGPQAEDRRSDRILRCSENWRQRVREFVFAAFHPTDRFSQASQGRGGFIHGPARRDPEQNARCLYRAAPRGGAKGSERNHSRRSDCNRHISNNSSGSESAMTATPFIRPFERGLWQARRVRRWCSCAETSQDARAEVRGFSRGMVSSLAADLM